MKSVSLGFEVGTGEPVAVPLRHLAVTGQTQESGKTTTLEALVARSGLPAIAFITKRGERAFRGGRRLQPYFRDRADWQFVDQLIAAQLAEKNKFLRPWIIKICRTTKTLADVHREVKAALAKAKGINEGVYTQLDAYLDLIVPEISRARLADSIRLEPGLNVMDVSAYPTPMQMLFVQSALDFVMAHVSGVVTIVPEAWEFVPEGKGSPAKASAVSLVRKGAGLGNYLWIDSQDMAGVDKTVLRGCAVWLIGVQREANEIKRNLANIPASIRRPSAADIARLKLGEFYACWGNRTVRVYVQPSWLLDEEARAVARGSREVLAVVAEISAATGSAVEREEEDPRMCERHQKIESELAALRRSTKEEISRLGDRVKAAEAAHAAAESRVTAADGRAAAADELRRALVKFFPMGASHGAGAAPLDEEAIVRRVLARVPTGAGGPIQVTPPEKLRKDFQIEETERIVGAAKELDPLQKRVLKLIESTENGASVSQKTVAERLGRSTGGGSWITLGAALKGLAGLGFIEVRERQGATKRLRQKIADDLAFYQASDAEVEAVYQNVIHEIATGAA